MGGAADRLVELARAQIGGPSEWSLATDERWLHKAYLDPGATAEYWELPSRVLGASAAVRLASDTHGLLFVSVTAMVRPGHESLWSEQLEWITSTVARTEEALVSSVAVLVASEALTDDEVSRWTRAGLPLVFEELAMERDLEAFPPAPATGWPAGTRVLGWGAEAAAASFRAYEESFMHRPGFPSWSEGEWLEASTAGGGFLADASFCVLADDVAVGFVVCDRGWIGQLGVVPSWRRVGLSSCLVNEALLHQQSNGVSIVRLHVSADNTPALATWQALGFRAVGRRGRFQRVDA